MGPGGADFRGTAVVDAVQDARTATSHVNSSTLAHVLWTPAAIEESVGTGPVPISATSTAPRDAERCSGRQRYEGWMGRVDEGRPARLGRRGIISVEVAIAHGRDRTPEVVEALGVEDRDGASSMAIPAVHDLTVTSRPGAFATERATGQ